MVRRSLLLASLSILAGVGCHAGQPPKVARTEPPITRADVSAARFVAQHNKNAAAVQSLTAKPRINPVEEDGHDPWGRAYGELALGGDKNFRLEIKFAGQTKADIGSNDKGFWFWVAKDPAKAIYVCDYQDIDSCQLAVTMQPDWIMEAMGLRAFSETEAKTMHAQAGQTPGTIVLTQTRKDARGQLYTKETIVNEATSRIMEHRLYSGAKKELLASAVVKNYMAVPLPNPANEDVGTGAIDPALRTIQIPENFRLTWKKERFIMDVGMAGVQVNETFSEKRRVALFSEPKIVGTSRQDLALLDPAMSPASRTYESRPIPDSGGIRLGTPEPVPIGVEGATRRQIDPAPLSPDLSSTPAQPAGVVGAVVPRGSYIGR